MLPYHPGELEVQARAGEFNEAVTNSAAIRSAVPPALARFLPTLRWVVLGAADGGGEMWATALFGRPGFLHAAGDTEIRIDSGMDPGDPVAEIATVGGTPSAGWPYVTPAGHPVGLLAIDLSRRFRARINGTVHPDGQGLTVRAHQVYANCMKYIQRRDLEPVADVPGASGQRGEPQSPAVPRQPHRQASAARRGAALEDEDVATIAAADTFFVATLAPGPGPTFGADASHRGGHPGFLELVSRDVVRFPDYPGNSMFNTLGNLEVDPRCGLLVPDFGTGDLLYLSGTAEVDDDPARVEQHPGARRLVTMSINRVVRRWSALPLRAGAVEYSPFLPPRRVG